MKRTLHLLGAGVPTPTPTRYGTSYALALGDELLMFDCGPAATHKLVKAGLWPTKVRHLFFTHHHFDHNADYPCFVLTRWDQGVDLPPLRVHGPPPLAAITERLFGEEGAYACDWKARVNWVSSQSVYANRGGKLPRPPLRVEPRELKVGDRVEGGAWSVAAGPAVHAQPWLHSLAYKVEHAGWTLVFASDTEYGARMVDFYRGADVLVVSCWDTQDSMEKHGEASGQTGTRDAARMAKEAGAKKLVLAHIGRNLDSPGGRKQGLADVAAIYGGEVVFGEELMAVEV
jgi:ribonuclease BN (tRNA processing enzyme)